MTIKQLLKKTKLKLLSDKYIFISIPLNQFNRLDLKQFQKKFFSITYEKDGITLTINEKNWNKIKVNFKKCKVGKNYRIITLDIKLNPNVVGYLAAISKILADNNISIIAISTYQKDHLMIKNKDTKKALKVLKKLKK